MILLSIVDTFTDALVGAAVAELIGLIGVAIWMWSRVKAHDEKITEIKGQVTEKLSNFEHSFDSKLINLTKAVEVKNDKHDAISKENQELTIQIRLAQEQIKQYDRRFDKLEQLIEQHNSSNQLKFIEFLDRYLSLENVKVDKILGAIKDLKV